MTTQESAAEAPAVDTSGRMLGLASIAAAPGALLISPATFSLLGFFLALMGMTMASPAQRKYSIIGMVAAAAAGGVGYAFNTPIF